MKKLIFVTICAILVILTSCGSGGGNNVANDGNNNGNNNNGNNNEPPEYNEVQSDILVNYIGDMQVFFVGSLDTEWEKELVNVGKRGEVAQPAQVRAYNRIMIEYTTETTREINERLVNSQLATRINPAKIQSALIEFKDYSTEGLTEHFYTSHSVVQGIEESKAELLGELIDHLATSIDTLSIESIISSE